MKSIGRGARRPAALAGAVAGAYLAFGLIYIIGSGYIAARWASSVSDLAHLEWLKGVAFIAVTAGLLFLMTRHLFRQLAAEAAESRKARNALLDSERRALAGVLFHSIVHDCGNLVQVASGYADLLARSNVNLPGEQRSWLAQIQTAIAKLSQTLERRRLSSMRETASIPSFMDVAEQLETSVCLIRAHPKVAGCQVRFEAAGPVPLTGYPALIHDAVANLVINAAEAMADGGSVTVRALPAPDGAELEVHDRGPGIAPAERERIFEGFYTTKAGGTGLGLLSVRACAEFHAGRVEVERSPLGGACFRLRLRNVISGPVPGPRPAQHALHHSTAH